MSADELKDKVESADAERVSSSGMDLSEKTRSASFLQQDSQVQFRRSLFEGVEIMSTTEALEKDPEARECYGKAFRSLGKEFPSDTEGGYFIRVKKGKIVELPIQACLLLKQQGFKQKVHNIVIIEEEAKVYLITGCSASKAADEGFHLGISEFFVRKNAYLNFTMIHTWKEDITVKPMGIALVDEGATYISNYICMKPVKEITMYPTVVLQGEGARASFNSLVLSHPNTVQDIGSRIIFKSKNTQGEVIARAVSLGGKMISRGQLRAEAENVKAHLECRGLIISKEGTVEAIPELYTDYRDVDMSHEAAIGKISKEEIEYLNARGMSVEEAQSIIIRGFMDVDILGLPDMLKKEIASLEEKSLKGNM